MFRRRKSNLKDSKNSNKKETQTHHDNKNSVSADTIQENNDKVPNNNGKLPENNGKKEEDLSTTKKMSMEGTLFASARQEIEESLKPAFDENPRYKDVFKVLLVPDKIHIWKAVWYDTENNLNVNWCYRVQQNGALGPYKGGLRFSPEVDLDTLRFLALEQVLKNALTGRALGGGKGGSDFNPRGRSDQDIKRFCEAFMTGLKNLIGPHIDVPAGDQGVGGREIGYLFGAWRRQGGGHVGVLTGKGTEWGGSEIRTEATGYGLLYITEEALKDNKDSVKGKHVLISGSGNVATFATRKAIALGAIVHSMSDRDGTYWSDKGLKVEDVDAILAFKKKKGSLPNGVEQVKDKKPWQVKVKEQKIDIALPCATQNEIEEEDAKLLVEERKIMALCEGANMPSTNEAIAIYKKAKIIYLSAKLSNLGGVGTSFMEMMQNASKDRWGPERVDEELKKMMKDAYATAKAAAKKYNVSISEGANLAGFIRVADAMIAQGSI